MKYRLRSSLRLCPLETRIVPATFTVMNLNDSGADSLRDCIGKANSAAGADTIDFKAGLTGAITLTSGEIAIGDAVVITGPGAATLSISGNNASRIFNTSTAATGTAIIISGLTLSNGKADKGGAMLLGDESLTLNQCVMTGNIATTHGGAMNASGASTVTANGCSFTNNSATYSAGVLLAINSAVKTLWNSCTISGNTCQVGGGGIYVGGDLLVEQCTISNNQTTNIVAGRGGGILASGTLSSLIIRNSTISGNTSAKTGGGIELVSFTGVLSVQNSTITNNTSFSTGGGIHLYSGTGTISLESTIVSGNSSPSEADINCFNAVSMKNSAVGSNKGFAMTDLGGNLAFGTSLKLGSLTDNGGLTQTHAILSGSPLINKGSNPASLTTDQRGSGYARVIGVTPDIGAVEGLTLLVSNTNDSGPGSLRAVLACADAQAGPDTVTFSAAVFATPQTITLTSGQISILDAVTILGPAAKVTIDGNASVRIFNTNSAPAGTIIEFNSLTLTNGKADNGGAIIVGNESIVLRSCAVMNCTATDFGGAIRVFSGELLLEECLVSGNTAASSGGGLSLDENSVVTIRRSTLSGNMAGVLGGAIFTDDGALLIDDSTLAGNVANSPALGGGAISFIGADSLLVRNSTLSGNSAPTGRGGGVDLTFHYGTATFQNCTITANSAAGSGGGIARSTAGGPVTLTSTIVAGNTSLTAPDLSFGSASIVTGSNNLIGVVGVGNFALTGQNNQFGSKSAPLNAKLGPLTANGGPTLTHALLPGSPAESRGANQSSRINDQRGVGFPGQVGVAVDIGATESTYLGPDVVSFGGGPGVTTSGLTSYSFSVTYADATAIIVNTLDDNDITVTGPAFPGGVAAKLVSVDNKSNGTPRTATYQFTAPIGGFTVADNGTYIVNVNNSQVQTVGGAFVPNRVPGNFVVAVPRFFVVNATNDEATDTDGKSCLREAILAANAGTPNADIINYDPAVFSGTQSILLTKGELAITDSVTIVGPAGRVIVNAGAASRHFNINGPEGLTVNISGMNLINGKTTSDAGSILIADEAVALSNMSITGNTIVSGRGGGIFSLGNLSVTDAIISNNVAGDKTNKCQGGGISLGVSATLTTLRSTISGNSSSDNGGGIYFFNQGSLTLTDSTVSGNSSNTNFAGFGGGGIYFFGAITAGGFTITNSTISGNKVVTGGSGGGLLLRALDGTFPGNVSIRNSTITANEAPALGGGIARTSGSGSMSLSSTIVAGNLVTGPSDHTSDLSFPNSVGGNNNLIGIYLTPPLPGTGNLTGNDTIPLDARLGPLANNGGPTNTHALLADSPAINHGNNFSGLSFDQRSAGFIRDFGGVDIGAFELQPPAPPVTIASVQINDGSAQRSRVTSLQVTFSTQVTFAGAVAGAFTLTRNGGGAVGGFTATANVGGGVTIVTLSAFVGAESQFGSLVDGQYTLSVLASQVLNLDGNNDGTPGDNFELIGNTTTNKLFRLFGDSDGNGSVTASDFNAFRLAYGFSGSSIFDFDNDGLVSASDFNQFRTRYGVSFSP